MINAVGRDIPEEILKATGKEVFQGNHHFDGHVFQRHGANTRCVINSNGSKVVDSIHDVLVKCGIKDDMTVSFHHHFREGDYVVNMVMREIHEMGIKDITICASSLGKAQDELVEYIEDGTITNIQSSGVRGKIGEAISNGKLQGLAIMRSHGGRVRALVTGETKIDIAFIGTPTCDEYGNCRGIGGKSDCGVLSYAMADADYADHVVAITDCMVPFPNFPAHISMTNVDYVVEVDAIGDPNKIATGAAKPTTDMRKLMMADYCTQFVVNTPYFKDGFSYQTGVGGASIASTISLAKVMKERGIAHEFNNFLTPIMGHAELLMMELPEGSDEQDSAKEILEASEKAMDVVKQISSLSRKNVETVYKCVPVRKMMQRVVKMISSVCPPQVTLESDIQIEDECILGNMTQLNQVILNICVNAVHAIGKKEGNIFIKCESVTMGQMEAILEKDIPDTWKNYIFISIRDDGCGMDKDTMRQIFDPFFTTKKGGEGTGLGLALAEQIVTSHKGYIFAESQPGKGSTFYIGIPVIDAEQAEATVTVSAKRETRMIFADDNAKVLELLRSSFEKLGINVTTCITMEEVSESLKAQEADVLVVEENIEGKSGVDFCMSIAGKSPDMIRLVSIDSISKEIVEAKRKGIIHGYVEKPISDRSVLEAVRECRKQL